MKTSYTLNNKTVEIFAERPRHFLGRFCLKKQECFIYDISTGMIDINTNLLSPRTPLTRADFEALALVAHRDLKVDMPIAQTANLIFGE